MTDQTRPMDAERIAEWDEGMVSFWLDGQTKVNNVDIARRDALALAVMAHAQHAEVARLTAERDAALLDVARMKDTQKDMGSLDDVLTAIMRRYPDDPYADYLMARLSEAVEPRGAELSRLRAVIEEAREMLAAPIEHEGDYSAHGRMFKVAEVLDRGLKGAAQRD